MMHNVFSENLAAGDGRIRKMDARAKLALALACVIAAIASPHPAAPLAIGAASFVLLAASGTPLRHIALRMSGPLLIASMMALFQSFIIPGRPLLHIGIAGFSITATSEGLTAGLRIISRVFGAAGSMLFLTMTTPAHRLLTAAAWLKVPRGLVELSLITYRYIFVLIEDAASVYQAQRTRLGYAAGPAVALRSLGTLCGTVLLRAYGQAEATGASMALRGYTGDYLPAHTERFHAFDALFIGLTLSTCIGLYLWT